MLVIVIVLSKEEVFMYLMRFIVSGVLVLICVLVFVLNEL